MVKRIAAMAVLSSLIWTGAHADEPLFYPAKGQSSAQQAEDKANCYTWAKQQLGYDPETLINQSQQAGQYGAEESPSGGAVRGAGKGAAVGAIGGAIGGDAGKGAAIGAGVGGAGGALRKRQGVKGEEQAQTQANTQVNQKLTQFNKAEGTCMKGKGYSVG